MGGRKQKSVYPFDRSRNRLTNQNRGWCKPRGGFRVKGECRRGTIGKGGTRLEKKRGGGNWISVYRLAGGATSQPIKIVDGEGHVGAFE